MAVEPLDLVGFTLIVDDIVTHDGSTSMEQLGGGGPQTLWGFQLVSRCLQRPDTRVALAAGVGSDLPLHCTAWLQGIGCDTTGLLMGLRPTPRAWQLCEADGLRTQVWRVEECAELFQQLRPRWEQLPAPLQAGRCYHVGIHASHPPRALLAALRAAAHARGGLLSVETYTACDAPPGADELASLLASVDVFSPNELEAASIVGPGSPQQLVGRLLAAGAGIVLLRRGDKGVLIGEQSTGAMWQLPAVPGTRVVDTTGCGNACCGGFLAAKAAGLSLPDSARWGCVAGSVMAEWHGVPPAESMAQHMQSALAKHQLLLGLGGRDEAAASSSSNNSGSSSSSSALCCVRRQSCAGGRGVPGRAVVPPRPLPSRAVTRRRPVVAPPIGRAATAVVRC